MDVRHSPDDMTENYLTPREAGERLPGTPAAQTMREWCARGLIRRVKRTPTGRWQIPESSLDELITGVEGATD